MKQKLSMYRYQKHPFLYHRASNQLLFSAQDDCLKLRKIHQLELKSPHRNQMNNDDSTVR